MTKRPSNRRLNLRAQFLRTLRERVWGGIRAQLSSRFEWLQGLFIPRGQIRVPQLSKRRRDKFLDNTRNLATPEGLEVRKLLAGDFYIASVSNPTEGSFGGFEIRLDGTAPTAGDAPVVVNYSVATSIGSGVLATPTDDYPALSGKVTFGVGQTQAIVNVSANDDNLLEPTEVVQISLTSVDFSGPGPWGTHSTLPVQQSIAILDTDVGTLVINAVDATASEINANDGKFRLNINGLGGISLANSTATTVTLSVTGTADNSVDYLAVPTVVTIPANAFFHDIDIKAIADSNNFEGDESVIVSVTGIGTSHPSLSYNATPATVTIQDPVRAIASLSSSATTLAEVGTSKIVYSVSLNSPAAGTVTLALDISGQVTSGDYTPASPVQFTMAPGSTVTTRTVTIVDDSFVEDAETLVASLTYVGGSVAINGAASTHTATINANDATTLSVSAGTVAESAGTALVTFSLNGGKAVDSPTTFAYTTAGTANAADYTIGAGTGNVVFSPGDSSKVVSVAINADTVVEGNENVLVSLSGQSGGAALITRSSTRATLGITDDDVATYSITGASAVESSNAVFQVSLSNPVEKPAVLSYALLNGTATNPADFTGATGGLVTVAAGAKTAALTINVVDDDILEPTEYFNVSLTSSSHSATGSVVAGPAPGLIATATIGDNDSAVVNLIAPTATINEPDAGTESQSFLVVLSNQVAEDTTVVIDFGLSTASLGVDFNVSSPATVTIPANQQVGTLSIDFESDALIETDETVIATIASVAAGALPVGIGSGATMTIIDDDFANVSLSPTTPVTVTEGLGAAFTLTQDSVATTDTVIAYTIVPGAVGPGGAALADITSPTSGTLTIAAGDLTTAVTINTFDDTIVEADQTFTINYSKVSSDPQVTFAPVTATVVIDDNDSLKASVSGPASLVEGNSGTTSLSYLVSLSSVSESDTIVRVQTVNGTGAAGATGGSDFATVDQTLTFAPGATTASVNVVVNGDTNVEPDETFAVSLTTISGGGASVAVDGSTGSKVVTILNDDTATLSLSGPSSVTEGTGVSPTSVIFTLGLSSPSSVETVVAVSTADGTAKSVDSDYTPLNMKLVTIDANTSQKTFAVDVTADSIDEAVERFSVSAAVSNTNGASVVAGTAVNKTLTINDDDDAKVTIKAVNNSVNEGAPAAFEISLTASSAPVTVFYKTVAGTAVNADFASTTLSSVVVPSSTAGAAQTINIATTADGLVEPNEDFSVMISSISGSSSHTPMVLTSTASVTIVDVDFTTLALSGPNAIAENGGPANFTISLGARTQDTVVSYTTSPGSALAGSDYTATSGTLLIPANASATSAVVPVTLVDNSLVEDDEDFTFSISLLNSNGVSINTLTSSKVVTITDDDAGTVSVQRFFDAAETTGGATGVTGRFLVKLDKPSDQPTTVSYSVAGSASSTVDFLALAETIVIPANSLSVNVDVVPINDTLVEGPETVVIQVTSVGAGGSNNVGFSSTPASLTIADNDTAVVNVIGNSVVESAGTATFTIELTKPSATTVTVPYTLSGGATNPADYTGGGTSPLVFNPGETAKTVVLNITNDSIVEGTEQVTLTTGAPTGNPLVSTGTGSAPITILDDDSATVKIIPAATPISESSNAQFIVLLSSVAQSDTTVTVNLSGTATTADYTNPAGTVGTVTITGGSASGNLFVTIKDDSLVESAETLIATIGTINGVGSLTTAAPTSATIVINDNDQALATVGSSLSVNETAAATANVNVTLSKASDTPTVVGYTLIADTAKTGGAASIGEDDYTGTAGSITINANTTVGTISIPIVNDNVVELNESFKVKLTSATADSGNPSVGVGAADTTTVSIYDADAASITIPSGVSLIEGTGAGFTNVTLTITQSAASSTNTEVSYAAVAGSASTSDFTPTSGTATIAAGLTSTTVVVPIVKDTIAEANETFTVELNTTLVSGNTQDITVGTPSTATVTIYDDDSSTLRIPGVASVNEASGSAVLTLSLTNPSGTTMTVDYTVLTTGVGATHASAADFNPSGLPTGSVVINPGQTLVPLTIPLNNENIVELDETFMVSLSNLQQGASSVSLDTAANTSTVTILNDDSAALRILTKDGPATSVAESAGNTGLFYLSLSDESSTATTVTYSIGGAASVGMDYTAFPSTAVIPAGTKSLAISVDVLDDALIENPEVIQVSLAATSNPNVVINLSLNDVADATIIDNDGTATLTSDTVADTITEGSNAVFILALSAAAGSDTVVSYDLVGSARFFSPGVSSGNPLIGNDTATTLGSGQATIVAGQTSVAVTIDTIDDNLVEMNEAVTLNNLNIVSGVTPIANSLTVQSVVVKDNDQSELVIVGDKNAFEAGPVNGRFRLILTNPVDSAVVVSAKDVGFMGPFDPVNSASSGLDFNGLPSLLTIQPGATSLAVNVTVMPDNAVELPEKIRYDATGILSSTYGGSLTLVNGSDSAIITLFDDDAAAVTVQSTVVAEDTGPANVLISLSTTSPVDTTVVYQLIGGTATVLDDFTGTPGTVVIPAGVPTANIPVSIVADSMVEADETFRLELTSVVPNGTSVTFAPGESASITITDDDQAFVSVVDTSITEGNDIVVQVSLSNPSDKPTTVTLGTLNGSAENVDYTPNATISVVVPASATLASVTVGTTNDDSLFEGAETVIVNVPLGGIGSPYSPGSIGNGAAGTVTILDNDKLTVTLTAPTATTDETGLPADGEFLISINGNIDEPVTIYYDTSTGTATDTADYAGLSGSVVIPTTSTTAAVVIDAVNDGLNEYDETVILSISAVEGAANSLVTGIGSAKTVTIVDVDTPRATAKFVSTNVDEGDAAVLQISLSKPATNAFTMAYGYGGNATDVTDYSGLTGSVTFTMGQTDANVTVNTVDDSFVEADETVAVTLGVVTSAATLAAVTTSPSTAVLTIVDNDDALLTVSKIQDAIDPNSGAVTNGIFLINLSSPSQTPTTVFFDLGGVATEGSDYPVINHSVVLTAGQVDAFVTIAPTDNTILENDETVEISLTSFDGNPFIEIVSTSDKTATLTIIDNDTASLTVDIAPTTVAEGGSFVYNISLSKPTEHGAVINLAPSGTGITSGDYTGLPSTISIGPGATTAAITVTAADDTIVEPDETLAIAASSPGSYGGSIVTVATSSDSIIIKDQDTLQVVGTPQVNSGAVQRSRVTELVVVLNGEVDSGQIGNFEVKNRGTAAMVDISTSTFVYNPTTGQTTVTLKFTGTQTAGGSLKDGNYELNIGVALVDVHGNVFDGDGNGSPGGGVYTFGNMASHKFYRYFGDGNGDRSVNIVDYFAFLGVYGSPSSTFSVDGTGPVDPVDYFAFLGNYGGTLNFS